MRKFQVRWFVEDPLARYRRECREIRSDIPAYGEQAFLSAWQKHQFVTMIYDPLDPVNRDPTIRAAPCAVHPAAAGARRAN
jgi:hypothetical protein